MKKRDQAPHFSLFFRYFLNQTWVKITSVFLRLVAPIELFSSKEGEVGKIHRNFTLN